jgi:hypothetical protein
MGRALATACALPRPEHEARTCRVVRETWRCPANIREPIHTRKEPGAIMVIRSLGGEFHGVVFAPRDGSWDVVGFESGDIL